MMSTHHRQPFDVRDGVKNVQQVRSIRPHRIREVSARLDERPLTQMTSAQQYAEAQ